MIPVVVLVMVPPALGGRMAQEFYQDFRQVPLLDARLGAFGPESGQALSAEAEGLTITLPGGRPDPAAVGIQPRFQIAGDFEITLGYEIVSAEQPQAGLGAGVKVWGKIDAEEFQAMTLAHLIRPRAGSAFVSIFAHGDEGDTSVSRTARRLVTGVRRAWWCWRARSCRSGSRGFGGRTGRGRSCWRRTG